MELVGFGLSKSTVYNLVELLSPRMSPRLVRACVNFCRCMLMKYGLSVSLHHDFDTHLKRLRVLTGSLLRISVIISAGMSILFNVSVFIFCLGSCISEENI